MQCTLSGLLFGISGSIASRNARRQKKRFVVTVLTLTVSITLFALFSTLTETVERSINGYIKADMYGLSEGAANIDFEFEIGNFAKGISTAETEKALADSGLFENIAVQVNQELLTAEDEDRIQVYYVNREAYTRLFGADAPVSYDELVSSNGYVYNVNCEDYAQYADKLQSGSLTLSSIYRTLPDDADIENMSFGDIFKTTARELKEHSFNLLGTVSMKDENDHYFSLYGAIETHEKITAERLWGIFLFDKTKCCDTDNILIFCPLTTLSYNDIIISKLDKKVFHFFNASISTH